MHRLLRRPLLALVLFAVLAIGAMGCIAPRPGAVAGPTEQWLLAQVNAQRAAHGVGPVAWCPTLGHAAVMYSADQAANGARNHVGSDGSDAATRVERAGYHHWTAIAENIAGNYPTVDGVLNGWMASPGHRANILNPAYTHMGTGFGASANGTLYWTQDFGRSGTC